MKSVHVFTFILLMPYSFAHSMQNTNSPISAKLSSEGIIAYHSSCTVAAHELLTLATAHANAKAHEAAKTDNANNTLIEEKLNSRKNPKKRPEAEFMKKFALPKKKNAGESPLG